MISPPPGIPDAEARFLWAEREQESGGNYDSVNSASGALGAYQIMPEHLADWLKRSGLPNESSQAFLKDHTAQDKVALKILGGYYEKYGDAGAAAMWYSGQPDPTKTYGNPPVNEYVRQVLAREKDAPGTGLPGGISGGTNNNAVPASVGSSALSAFLDFLGITDIYDALERGALMVSGAVLLIIGLIKFTGTDAKVKQAAKTALAVESGGVVK